MHSGPMLPDRPVNQKLNRQGSPISETSYESLKRESMPCKWDKSLPFAYSINNTRLNLNLDCDGLMRIIERKQFLTPLAVPKLNSARTSNKPRTTVTVAGRESPVLNLGCLQISTPPIKDNIVDILPTSPLPNLDWLKFPRPISPIKDNFIDLLPTSADKWACKKNAEQTLDYSRPIIISEETLPPRAPAPNTQDEDAMKQWLHQLKQDLSRGFQSRFESMTETNVVQEKPASAATSTTNKSIVSETQIDQNMTEFREPQSERKKLKKMIKKLQRDTIGIEITIELSKEETKETNASEEYSDDETDETNVLEVGPVKDKVQTKEGQLPDLMGIDEETQPETEKQILDKTEIDIQNQPVVISEIVLPLRTKDEDAIEQCQQQVGQDLSRVDDTTLKQEQHEELPQEKTVDVDIEEFLIFKKQSKEGQLPDLMGIDEETQPETEKQTLGKTEIDNHQPIMSPCAPAHNPQDEDAIKQWLQHVGQDLSRLVQSRFDSMTETNIVQEQATAVATLKTNKKKVIETQIQPTTGQVAKRNENLNATESNKSAVSTLHEAVGQVAKRNENLNTTESNKSAVYTLHEAVGQVAKRNENLNTTESNKSVVSTLHEQVPSTRQMQIRKKRPLKNVTNKNMTEFRAPKPFRNYSENCIRYLLMPQLPSYVDHRLEQIRILRRAIKPNPNRTLLNIGIFLVPAYCSLQAKRMLDLNKLALEMQNAVYNSDIQVLQINYENGQVVWIWGNGSILITNARNTTVLAETQYNLLFKILGVTQLPDLVIHHGLLLSRMIHITKFEWETCIQEFSQIYCLNKETVLGNDKYALYVNRSIPNVAAKVYENGSINLYTTNTDNADKMLKKLYLLTRHHPKPRTIIQINKMIRPNAPIETKSKFQSESEPTGTTTIVKK